MNKRIIYDFTQCDLELLEELYFEISEQTRKRFLGEAVCNWLLWGREKGAIQLQDDKEFESMMNAYFPGIQKVEYVKYKKVREKEISELTVDKPKLGARIKSLLFKKVGDVA